MPIDFVQKPLASKVCRGYINTTRLWNYQNVYYRCRYGNGCRSREFRRSKWLARLSHIPAGKRKSAICPHPDPDRLSERVRVACTQPAKGRSSKLERNTGKDKFEIRISKFETNSNSKNLNDKNNYVNVEHRTSNFQR